MYTFAPSWKTTKHGLQMSSEKHTSNPRNVQRRTIKGSELKQRLFLETQTHRLRVVLCSYHVTCAFQSESSLCSCLIVKELLARNRRDIWSLSYCNGIRTNNHLVRLRTEWLWVRIPLQSLIQIHTGGQPFIENVAIFRETNHQLNSCLLGGGRGSFGQTPPKLGKFVAILPAVLIKIRIPTQSNRWVGSIHSKIWKSLKCWMIYLTIIRCKLLYHYYSFLVLLFLCFPHRNTKIF